MPRRRKAGQNLRRAETHGSQWDGRVCACSRLVLFAHTQHIHTASQRHRHKMGHKSSVTRHSPHHPCGEKWSTPTPRVRSSAPLAGIFSASFGCSLGKSNYRGPRFFFFSPLSSPFLHSLLSLSHSQLLRHSLSPTLTHTFRPSPLFAMNRDRLNDFNSHVRLVNLRVLPLIPKRKKKTGTDSTRVAPLSLHSRFRYPLRARVMPSTRSLLLCKAIPSINTSKR